MILIKPNIAYTISKLSIYTRMIIGKEFVRVLRYMGGKPNLQ